MSKKLPEFVEFIVDSLIPVGAVHARGMFGGWGLYLDGLMFALIDKDELYIKADETNKQDFINRRMLPFTYGGKRVEKVEMPYYNLPTDAYDDLDLMVELCRTSVEAAKRQHKKTQ